MTSKSLTVDTSNSAVSFKVKKLGMLTVNGTITNLTGDIIFDKNHLDQANFNVSVHSATIDTGNAKRDEHLKSADFFDVGRNPEISFQSTSVQSATSGYKAVGHLSMLGASREVVIPFSLTNGVFIGQLSINRFDHKLGEKFPAFFIGKTIQISITCKIKN